MTKPIVIDCHCHAGIGDAMTAPWNTDAPIAPYLRRARQAGIDKTIVFAPFHSDYDQANRYVARIVRSYRPRLIGFAFVHATRDAGRILAMLTRARRWGFLGIKAHGFEAMPTRELCEAARTMGMPLLIDVVSRAEVIDLLAPRFPAVNFIVAHLGSFADDWRAHQRVIEQLIRYPNVYADTSAVRRFDYIVEAVQRAGARKVLFGSDGPWLHPGLELYKIRLLNLPPEQESLILGGNILRLLRQVPPAAESILSAARVSRMRPALPQPAQTLAANPPIDNYIESEL